MRPPINAKLSNVALEYLRNHDELEAARELFLGERKKLLDELGGIMLEATRQRKLVIADQGRVDQYGLFNVFVRGRFVTARGKSGKKKQSGYSIALGSFVQHAGAQAVLWFEMKLTPARRQELEIEALEKTLGVDVKATGEGGFLYIRTAAQPPSSLDLAALEGEARQLPELFATADDWLARRFKS
jgi:hypothetical protein